MTLKLLFVKKGLKFSRCQFGTSNREPTMFALRSDHIIYSDPLFRAGLENYLWSSALICVHLRCQLIFLMMKIITRIQKLWNGIKKKFLINFRYKFL